MKHNFLLINGVFCDRYEKPLKGAALYNAKAAYLNGGLKQTLDQNERLKEALYYSLSLNREQGKKIQHLENILGSVLPALNLNFPSLDFNER
ncbi:hypothetical protein CV729_03680 [Helicobacter pylori]|uniref:hypothetical protein n=1 Tax=Helicobacter pylori TaxID=210 RepID=UPI0011986E6B|nr:hypothetical protein [Helicobacter pylori]QDY62200.1 hypothetical protein CV729_03680 [Helicobacter pylori]